MGNIKKETRQREPGWYFRKENENSNWAPWFWNGQTWSIDENSSIQHSEDVINFYDIETVRLKPKEEPS